KVAVAKRPVEEFETEVTLPEYELEPDDETYFNQPDNGQFVDENGMPIERAKSDDDTDPADAGTTPYEAPARIDQRWIDNVLGREKKPAKDKGQGQQQN
ncbi:MAG: penicillin-binding protein, partial [Sphingobium phenoxybenzoativorans]